MSDAEADARRQSRFGLSGAALDAVYILGAMLGLYVLFTAIGVVLNYQLSGIINLVREVTFYVAVYAIVVLGLNLQWGYAGLFNIGIAGYLAVGVYGFGLISGSTTGTPTGLGLPFPVGVLGGMLLAALFGLITALPALRLKADYLAIVTIAFAEIIRIALGSRAFEDVTGGGAGFSNFPANPANMLLLSDPTSAISDPTPVGEVVFGLFESVGVQNPVVGLRVTYVLLLVVVVAVVYVLLRRIANSPFGRVLKAIREDELVAQSLGKDTRWFKIKTFMLGCALMGLGGILWYAYGIGSVNPADNFKPPLTFYLFIALIIGGAGSNTGSILGGALFSGILFLAPQYANRVAEQFLPNIPSPNNFVDAVAPLASLDVLPLFGYFLGSLDQMRFVLIGALLVWLMQNRPEGLLGHRVEPASSVDLMRRDRDPPKGSPAADGGRTADDGGADDE
ncbi:branched-chain amino acid ABC transporter permease [Halomarina salina]|uniref:Branched-chain amino acid ABC transporter permease n=1 Tax=Halomarina salina TaxID=1872699 RepID=A0ABD5RRL8_9EURY|nr:branched-chain amino acid ABC transporter permease [Halomarina salina]